MLGCFLEEPSLDGRAYRVSVEAIGQYAFPTLPMEHSRCGEVVCELMSAQACENHVGIVASTYIGQGGPQGTALERVPGFYPSAFRS